MNTLQNSLKQLKQRKPEKHTKIDFPDLRKPKKVCFFVHNYSFWECFWGPKSALGPGTEQKNQKKPGYLKMSGKKRLFRGESYTENPKSVPHLAGHLQSEMSYKVVYNKRPVLGVFRVFRVFTCFACFRYLSTFDGFLRFCAHTAHTWKIIAHIHTHMTDHSTHTAHIQHTYSTYSTHTAHIQHTYSTYSTHTAHIQHTYIQHIQRTYSTYSTF